MASPRICGKSIWTLVTAFYAGTMLSGLAHAQAGPATASACRTPPVPPSQGEIAGGAFRVSSVNVEVNGKYEGAPPRDGWSPKASNLELVHRRGQNLDRDWVCEQFAGFAGRDTPADAIADMVQRINLAYVANGYINSGVRLRGLPDSGSGAVQLELVFGSVQSPADPTKPLQLSWPVGRSGLGDNFIRDRLPSLDIQPFNALQMEREFRSLAENPNIQLIEGGLQPGTEPGQAYVDFRVTPQPQFDFYLNAANSRSPTVGGERIGAGGSFRNGLFDGDILTAEYGQTEGLYDAFIAYQMPFLHPRLTLDVRGEVNEADVVDPALLALDIRSESQAGEVGLGYKLVQRPILPREDGKGFHSARTVSVGARVSHKESQTFLLGMPFSFSPGSIDGKAEITATRLTVDWVERAETSVSAASLIVSHGLDGSGTDIPGVIAPNPNFTTAFLQLSHARALPLDFQLNMRVAGQWASGTLYSAERFSVGGETTVRGYRENLLLADSGVMGRIEITHALNVGGSPDPSRFNWGAFRLGVFGDYATTRNEFGENPDPAIISSAGMTIEWAPSAAVRANVSYGLAFEDVAQPAQRDLQDDGIHFRIEIHPLDFFRRKPTRR